MGETVAEDKLDEYQKAMEEKLKGYKDDLKPTGDELKQEYEDFGKKLKHLVKRKMKFAVRTPSAALAVRGTEFLVIEDKLRGTEIIVLEDCVEVRGAKEEETAVVNAGHRAAVMVDGGLIGDLLKMQRWWL